MLSNRHNQNQHLTRLLFFFQSIPVEVPSKQFIEWRRIFSVFIWKGLKPRVRYNTLQLPKEKGGLSLPNMEHYYKSAELRYLIYWCNPCYNTKWKIVDLSQLDIPLQTLLGDRNLYSSVKENLNCWTKTPLNIWLGECRKLKMENHIKILRWVAHDKDFKPANSGVLVDFQKRSARYHLEKQDFFRYLQVRSHFNSNIKTTEDCNSDLITILIDAYKSKLNRKCIDRIY